MDVYSGSEEPSLTSRHWGIETVVVMETVIQTVLVTVNVSVGVLRFHHVDVGKGPPSHVPLHFRHWDLLKPEPEPWELLGVSAVEEADRSPSVPGLAPFVADHAPLALLDAAFAVVFHALLALLDGRFAALGAVLALVARDLDPADPSRSAVLPQPPSQCCGDDARTVRLESVCNCEAIRASISKHPIRQSLAGKGPG